MTHLISELSSVMQKEVSSLNKVAQNTANVNTSGFKSLRVGLQAAKGQPFLNMISQVDTVSGYDKRVGSIQMTNRNTDVALQSEGWFGVNKPEGMLLTRNGHFSISENGLLTTKDGALVQGLNGHISGLDINGISINSKGVVSMNGSAVGTIAVFNVDKNDALTSLGDGLYKASGKVTFAENSRLLPGALEGSNVETSAEMLRVIETTRHIETMQRAMSSYDELLKIGINQIGKQ